MRKLLFFILLSCGIVNANGQNWLNKMIDKQVAKSLQPRNYVYKKYGEIYEKKSNGKEKKVSEIGSGGIDTLFIEDPSVTVGEVCINPKLYTKDIKVIMSNNVVYLKTIWDKLSIENFSQGIASYRGVQGFQAQKPDGLDCYSLDLRIENKGDRKNVSQLNLPDAIVIDGEVGKLRGYFSGAKINKVVFSPKIRKIGKGAFRYCGWLQEIVFPEGCDNVEIDPEAFAGCDDLEIIRVPTGKKQYYVNMGLSEALVTEGNADSNNDEIKNLIKQGYVDPSFTKLYTVDSSEKVYMFQDEENVAVQGRACWKTDMEYILFGSDNSMGIISASTIDLIAPNGGHGERINKIGPKGKECRFILVKGIIYKWEKEDYSDLQRYMFFDSNNNILMSVDKKKKYNPINKNEL